MIGAGRQVGIANAEVDDIDAFRDGGLRHFIDGGEQIRGRVLILVAISMGKRHAH